MRETLRSPALLLLLLLFVIPAAAQPAGSIVINSAAQYTTSASVSLTLTATDAAGVAGYFVSNSSTTPSAGNPGWVAVTPTVTLERDIHGWSIAGVDGTKTVYAWFKDAAANISTPAWDVIVLDRTPPTNPQLTATAGIGEVELSWSGESDPVSGVAGTFLVYTVGSTPPANCATSLLATYSPFTHTGLIPGETYAYRVCATDSAGNTSTGSTATQIPYPAGTVRVRNDINGDGKADMFWRNSSTGGTLMWFMNGATLSSSVSGPTMGAGWLPAVSGDFDGDGRTGFLWRNYQTGAHSIWLGWNGSAFATIVPASTIPREWEPLHGGDIDGDGKTDVFWYNFRTGETSIWFMNGATISNAVRSTTVPLEWRPRLVGDFNGDSKSDVFWNNDSTGETSLWMSWNGTTWAKQVRSVTVPADSGWTPYGAGDFNGDGRSDIFWCNFITRQASLWIMKGGNPPIYVVLPDVLRVNPRGFGDYDGDARADVFWRDGATGDTWVWMGFDGTTFPIQLPSSTIKAPWLPFEQDLAPVIPNSSDAPS